MKQLVTEYKNYNQHDETQQKWLKQKKKNSNLGSLFLKLAIIEQKTTTTGLKHVMTRPTLPGKLKLVPD